MRAGLRRVLVTGPHRSGTTIASEIIAAELGLSAIRECDLACPRFDGDSEPDLSINDIINMPDGVLQGATTFKWLPSIAEYFDTVVVVKRDINDILRSQKQYRGRYLDDPVEKYKKLEAMNLSSCIWMEYEAFSRHPLFHKDRKGWKPRQTSPL